MAGLEQLRDLYDRWNFGMVIIGMPGLEKRLARYPQLYSRVGFVHQFHVHTPRRDQVASAGALESFGVERILQINSLHTVTKEVVETARESLVLGQA